MIKRIIIAVIAAIAAFFLAISDGMIVKAGEIKFYTSNIITAKILENRNGTVIVEIVIGEVLDSEGNGKVLNPTNEEFNYINYSRVPEIKPGKRVVTWLVYNPENNYIDDVIQRYDWIIS